LSLEDLDEFLNERLARYKHPKGLEIVDALPRNPAGKVLKTELRARYGASDADQSAYASTDPTRGG
jgi:fatty-acyl-CoA synthase